MKELVEKKSHFTHAWRSCHTGAEQACHPYLPLHFLKLCDGPHRPALKKYPSTQFGNQQRSFNRGWLDLYSWLEYSVIKNASFCFACRHFLSGGHGFHSESTFTVSGYRNWRKATTAFKTHHISAAHKFAMESWAEFRLREKDGSRLGNLLDKGHSKIVQENHEYMRAVVETLRYTACQGIAQRAHREDDGSGNRGNFVELLSVIGQFDKTVAKKLEENPGNAKYTHHDIQNEILGVMADMVRRQISTEIKEAEQFAILVDECKDVSKKEQISVVVHYLSKETVPEKFLHFTPAEGLDAESLLKSIEHTLAQYDIDKNLCIGQCYDGAAVMSGCNNGVPQALYVHCHAHRLNLVLVDVVSNVPEAGDFFETVQLLYNFFSNSVAHNLFVKKQNELEPTAQPMELKKLSDTRWACQYTGLCAIRKTLPSIVATLQDIMGQPNPRRKTEARAIHGLINEHFVLLLTLFEDLFRSTKFMSDQLQSPSLELSSASELAQSVIDALSAKRGEESWSEILARARDLCDKAGIQSRPHERRQAQPPQRLQDFVVEAQTERTPVTSSDDLRKLCFYPVIDRLLTEMKRWFSAKTGGVLTGVSALSPKHKLFLDRKSLWPMAQYYGVTEVNLTAEVHQVRRLLETKQKQGQTVNGTVEFLSLMTPYRDAFTDLYKLICISLTLPVTSASCEWSFSCLKRIINYLRNSSGDSRNSDLTVLAINSRRTKALDIQKIIDAFATNHNNRRIVLL
uniref:TTF-type domain-containing protein n=1 Tax=Myripristis murdjan TaxID=586833 RepID=A0A667WAX6_9TELE